MCSSIIGVCKRCNQVIVFITFTEDSMAPLMHVARRKVQSLAQFAVLL